MKVFQSGHIEIARRQTPAGDWVTLAMSPRPESDFDPYVTARLGSDSDTEWYWGSYHKTIEAATAEFADRSSY